MPDHRQRPLNGYRPQMIAILRDEAARYPKRLPHGRSRILARQFKVERHTIRVVISRIRRGYSALYWPKQGS